MGIPKYLRPVEKKLSQIQTIPIINKWLPSSAVEPTVQALKGHKKAQALAYKCALAITQEMRPGQTEKQVAQMMDQWLKDHGVKSFFHKSFAWFGNRASFWGFSRYRDFLPSKHILKENDVFILDTAPIVDKYAGDIGFTSCLNPKNEDLIQAQKILADFRHSIPKLFQSNMKTCEIWQQVDEEIQNLGFKNCHADYPFKVLGHRLHKTPLPHLPGVVSPFGWQAYLSLISRGLIPELLGPNHEGEKIGIWAIEPHLGNDKFGFKFEEILVVEKERAYWLDDNVPHNQPVLVDKHEK